MAASVPTFYQCSRCNLLFKDLSTIRTHNCLKLQPHLLPKCSTVSGPPKQYVNTAIQAPKANDSNDAFIANKHQSERSIESVTTASSSAERNPNVSKTTSSGK